MTTGIRYVEIQNDTGAVFNLQTAFYTPVKDGALQFFKRVFATIDIGTTKGKTQDSTTPVQGCLLVSINAGKIKEIAEWQAYRPTVVQGAPTLFPLYGLYSPIISEDEKSISLLDPAEGGTTLQANDFIVFGLITSNN